MDRSRSRSIDIALTLMTVLLLASPLGILSAQEPADAPPAAPPPEAVEPTSPEIVAADDAARTWLALVDERKYEEAWAAGSNVLQVSISPQKLKSALDDGRRGLDSLAARTLIGIRPVTNPSDRAPGEYVVLRYRLQGSPAWSAIETVVPRREDGVWRVTGYAIKRN